MNEVIGFILDIVNAPAFLVALIALLGLALLRKPAPEMIKGTLKTFVGFLVLSGGAPSGVRSSVMPSRSP